MCFNPSAWYGCAADHRHTPLVPEMTLTLDAVQLLTYGDGNMLLHCRTDNCDCDVAVLQITDTPLTPEMTPASEAVISSSLHHPNILVTLRYACRPHKVVINPRLGCTSKHF